MTRVVLTGRLTCTSAKDAALVRALLPDHIAASRAEAGCLRFDVVPDPDGLVWHVSEEFASPTAFATHQTRTQSSRWGRDTAHIRRDFSRQDPPET